MTTTVGPITTIPEFEERARFPILGKIRLGITKTAANGKEYPAETPHFVIDDAPGVREVYGDEPKELDIMFPHDDRGLVMPYSYKLYSGGTRDKDGNLLGGKLKCQGNGIVANHFALRDLATGVVPTRPCLKEKCPDWADKNGRQQCGPSMSVLVVVPRVSLMGVYQMDTKSRTAMNNFINQLKYIQETFGFLKGIAFKMKRVPTKIPNPKTGEMTLHYPVQIFANDKEFQAKYGDELKKDVLRLAWKFTPPSPQELLEGSSGFPYSSEAGEAPRAIAAPGIGQVAEDRELAPLFEELASLLNVPNTAKSRMLTARKYEGAENPKAELTNYLKARIQGIKEKAAKPVDTPKPEVAKPTPPEAVKPAPAQKPHPAANEDGLI